jgi:hypothetical protein
MWYYPDKKILHHLIHKYMVSDELRNSMNLGVDILKKNRACKWLSDDRSFSTLPKEDVEWGLNIWAPRALASGWRHWAVVLPKLVIGQLAHKKMAEIYRELGLNVEVFTDTEKGIAWLEEQ